jgi:hypothetical protein
MGVNWVRWRVWRLDLIQLLTFGSEFPGLPVLVYSDVYSSNLLPVAERVSTFRFYPVLQSRASVDTMLVPFKFNDLGVIYNFTFRIASVYIGIVLAAAICILRPKLYRNSMIIDDAVHLWIAEPGVLTASLPNLSSVDVDKLLACVNTMAKLARQRNVVSGDVKLPEIIVELMRHREPGDAKLVTVIEAAETYGTGRATKVRFKVTKIKTQTGEKIEEVIPQRIWGKSVIAKKLLGELLDELSKTLEEDRSKWVHSIESRKSMYGSSP